MTDVAARFRAFKAEAPHWATLLAQVPARHILRHDTAHPAFHGCIDWHSACHAAWALLAHRRLTGDARYDGDRRRHPDAGQAGGGSGRPGGAAAVRDALWPRLVPASGSGGSAGYRFDPADLRRTRRRGLAHGAVPRPDGRSLCPRIRQSMLGADQPVGLRRSSKPVPISPTIVRETAQRHGYRSLDRLPAEAEEETWPDFMAVTPMFCELLVRAGACRGRNGDGQGRRPAQGVASRH